MYVPLFSIRKIKSLLLNENIVEKIKYLVLRFWIRVSKFKEYECEWRKNKDESNIFVDFLNIFFLRD